MKDPERILVYHPGAIGDVMLATPVAVALKRRFPNARLVHSTHPGLARLLDLCGAIDKVVDCAKHLGIVRQWQELMRWEPDLLVDLSGSLKSRVITSLTGSRVVHYSKHKDGGPPTEHAVENFFATLKPLHMTLPAKPFPTLDVTAELLLDVQRRIEPTVISDTKLIGLVPGVGKLRSHRAWTREGWIQLAQRVNQEAGYFSILVGGEDESALCREIEAELGSKCLNLAGKLSLVETAATLRTCRLVISADTGPAHIAVAVGVAVIGLYGPTFPQRSGPCGCHELLVDRSNQCRCHDFKSCQVTQEPGPGECMQQIAVDDVWARLQVALNAVP